MKQKFKFSEALKTALGMSFISMISMEIAINLVVYVLVGDAGLRGYTQQDETRARAILLETDLANADHNLLRGDPSLTSIFDTYNPSSALIR